MAGVVNLLNCARTPISYTTYSNATVHLFCRSAHSLTITPQSPVKAFREVLPKNRGMFSSKSLLTLGSYRSPYSFFMFVEGQQDFFNLDFKGIL